MSVDLKAIKTVFMGSPEFALPSIRALHEKTKLQGVVTQPDRFAGRGRKLTSPAVKIFAQSKEIPLIQPRKLSAKAAFGQLEEWRPDLIVVAAYGQILRSNVLNLPEFGCLNVHASLLPRWRGAAPIQASILHGDDQTGITIMRMDEGLDTGPIISQQKIPISPGETAASLSEKLSLVGAKTLIASLPGYLSGEAAPVPQEDSQSSYAPMLTKANGKLDLNRDVDFLARQIRAYDPWPGSFLETATGPLKIYQARAIPKSALKPGNMEILNDLPAIAAKNGWLLLERLQAPSKKVMSGADYLRGAKSWQGNLISQHEMEKI